MWPTLPRLTPERLSTLLGVLGLLCLPPAVWGLTRSPWWALLAVAVELLFCSWALSTQVRARALRPAAAPRPDRRAA